MHNQHKMYRVIKLIEFLQLKERHPYTMAKYLNVSNRTVYRYLDLYKSLGYEVIKVNSKFKLIKQCIIKKEAQDQKKMWAGIN